MHGSSSGGSKGFTHDEMWGSVERSLDREGDEQPETEIDKENELKACHGSQLEPHACSSIAAYQAFLIEGVARDLGEPKMGQVLISLDAHVRPDERLAHPAIALGAIALRAIGCMAANRLWLGVAGARTRRFG